MEKSNPVEPKKRGRPPSGGRDPLVGVRFPPAVIKAVDHVAKAKGVTRSDVIRKAVEQSVRYVLKKQAMAKAR
jgi:metal-responsive CopG/Arc/MetJ family transcriptional regulator